MPPTIPPSPPATPTPDRPRWPEIAAMLTLAAAISFWATRPAARSGESDRLRAEVAELQGQVESLRAANRDVTQILAETSEKLVAAKGEGRRAGHEPPDDPGRPPPA